MPLSVRLNYDTGVPVFRQIYDAVAAALVTGELKPDEQLPTIHALARELDVNPNTIIRAYRELEHAGLVAAERGRGTFPVARPNARTDDKGALLRKIVQRAFKECAKHGISAAELVLFLRKEFQ
jgi:GntR family transcriptional regulator